MRLREPYVYFVDRCLGSGVVPTRLREALAPGESVVVHDDLFQQGAPDEEWLTRVGAAGWVGLTKDSAIRRHPLELQALLAARSAVFTMARADLRAEQTAEAIVAALPRIRKALRRFDVPILGRLDISGGALIHWASGEVVAPPKRIK